MQYGGCAAVKMSRHQQVAHNHTLSLLPNTLDTPCDHMPIVGHAADTLATTQRTCTGTKLQIGQVDVNRVRQQVERGLGQVEVAIKDRGDGESFAYFSQRRQNE